MPILTNHFATLLRQNYPPLSGIIQQNLTEFGQNWANEFDDLLQLVTQGEITALSPLVTSYTRFALSILMSQKRYELTGHYENHSYAEVKTNYYDNVQFVQEEYMPGLLLSHYLWPHHYRLLRFFLTDVMDHLTVQKPQTFCEVGVGTALYAMKTVQHIPEIQGTGYDISAPALDYGKQIMLNANLDKRFTFQLQDILDFAPPQFDFLICQEVLEHLEDPALFTKHLAAMLKPGGAAYITAAITAGQWDHIYLFETVQEIYDLLQNAGLMPLMMRMDGAHKYNDLRYRPRVAAFYCERLPTNA